MKSHLYKVSKDDEFNPSEWSHEDNKINAKQLPSALEYTFDQRFAVALSACIVAATPSRTQIKSFSLSTPKWFT